jgi:hypothetical protein
MGVKRKSLEKTYFICAKQVSNKTSILFRTSLLDRTAIKGRIG